MFRLACRLLVASVLLASCWIAEAQEDPFTTLFGDGDRLDAGPDERPGEDDVRLVGLRLGSLKLTGALTAYERPEGLCVVASELFNAVDAPVNVDDEGASGWFLARERTIDIDFAGKSVRLGRGDPISLEARTFATPDGWCLTGSALSDILPIDFSYDSGALTLRMEPREPLPLEARLEREAVRARLESRGAKARPGYEEIDNPYQWLSWPTADISLDLRAGPQGIRTDRNLELAGDLLLATARLRSARNEDGSAGIRLSLERVFEPAAPGLQPRQLRFGDISGLAQPIISRGKTGRGVMITNRPAYVADVFDMTDIRGALPSGWEAELHRDGQLLAFVTEPDSQGEYVFENVEIRPGYNRYTVRMFGPHGEVDTREVKFFAGREMRPENEVQYEFALVQEGISVDGETSGEIRNVAAASISYGVTRSLSARVDTRLAEHGAHASALSLTGARADTHGVLRVGRPAEGGAMVKAGAVHLFRDRSSLRGEYSWYDGDARGSTRRPVHSLELEYDAVLPITRRGLPLKADANWRRFADGGQVLGASARLSSAWRGLRWSHTGAFEQVRDDVGATTSRAGGTLALSRRFSGFRLRGELAYDLTPGIGMASLDMAVRKRLKNGSFFQASVSRDIQAGKSRFASSFAREFDNFSLSVKGGFDDAGAWTAGLRLSTALFFDDRSSVYRNAPPGLARTGALRARVFDDMDGDGHLGPPDRPLEGASFIIDQSVRRDETGEDGEVVISGIDNYRPVDVELSLGSLSDPFLQPRRTGASVTLRPGQVVALPVPLSLTGEADGTIELLKDGLAVPVSGVTVEALDAEGRVLARSLSEYDGYFYFDGLPMGEVELRIAPDALKGLQGEASSVSVKLTREEPFVPGANLQVVEN